jgi:membrane protein required for colicin V production
MRGLVQEVLSARLMGDGAFALHFLHPYLTEALRDLYKAGTGVSLLGFVLLLLIPYAAMKVIIGNASEASRWRHARPDRPRARLRLRRVKGALIAVFAFALLVTGFDDSWGYKGRPQWITTARTYAAADSFSRQLAAR